MSGVPAGWYADPERAGQQRYWDGAAWTEHRAPGSHSQAVARPTSRKATASLVCGVLTLLGIGFFLGLPAAVLGWWARREIDASEGRLGGRTEATVGMVVGLAATVVWAVVLVGLYQLAKAMGGP
jgi:hypothetical protein